MRRLLGTVLAVVLAGGIVAVPTAAVAATSCSRSWHYITHGETGLNLRPDPSMYQGNTTVYADGIPGNDFWNQQFLFCRDPGWSEGHYAIYSNLTKAYWSVAADVVYAGAPAIENTQQLFHVWRYDSTWWVIRFVGFAFYPKYAYPNRRYGWNNQLEVGPGPLNGAHLFRISPSNLMG